MAPLALELGDSPQLPLFWLVPSPVSPVAGAVWMSCLLYHSRAHTGWSSWLVMSL